MRTGFYTSVAIACLLAVALPQPSAGVEARPQGTLPPEIRAFRDARSAENRLTSVFHRVAATASEACAPFSRSSLGVSLRSVAFFAPDQRALAERLYGIDDHVFVEHVVPGFPGERAGIAAGDMVLSIDGRPLGRGAMAREALEAAVKGSVWSAQRPILLEIDRAGLPMRIEISPARICAASVDLVGFDDVFAVNDGDRIEITQGLMAKVKNDAHLAMVIGHQLALGLAARAEPRRFDADRAGLEFAHLAGYDITGAPSFWRDLARQHPRAYARAPNQPVAMDRFARVEEVVREIVSAKSARR